jgi:hypothetical protein
MNRKTIYYALLAIGYLAQLSCAYENRPQNGGMLCGSAGPGVKRCPDDYDCYTGAVGVNCTSTCWRTGQTPDPTTQCQSGPDAGNDVDAIDFLPPTVLSITPGDMAQDVDPTTIITIRFSQPLDSATVDHTTITVSSDFGAVSGAVSYADSVVTFVPDTRLDLLATYVVVIRGTVSNTDGLPLGSDVQSGFTVRDGAWTPEQTPVPAGSSSGFPAVPVVGMDAQGNVLVVWDKNTSGTAISVVARWYNRRLGWQDAVVLIDSPGEVYVLAASVGPSGDAVVALYYQPGDATTAGIYAIQYRRGTWETTATMLIAGPIAGSLGGSDHDHIAAAMSPAGEAHVMWTQSQPDGSYVVQATHASPTGTWNVSHPQIGAGYSSVSFFRLSFNDYGDGLAFWVSPADSTNNQIYAARYLVSGQSWTVTVIPGSKYPLVNLPALAFDDAGDAMATWAAGGGGTSSVYASAFSRVDGWATPSPAFSSPSPGHLVFDGMDYVADGVGTTLVNEQSVRYSSGVWGPPMPISDGEGSIADGAFAADRRGNLLAIWAQQISPSAEDIEYARYVKGLTAWIPPGKVNQTKPGNFSAAMVMAPDGTAAALWIGIDNTQGGVSDLYISFFE